MSGLKMKYFVMKPGGDDLYAHASRLAMRAYASAVEYENAELSADLFLWVNAEEAAAINRKKDASRDGGGE